jgi:anti-sigma factor RsiW
VTGSGTRAREGDDHLLFHAYVDGELDVVSTLAVEGTMREDPAVANSVSNITALQKVLRDSFPPEPLPAALRSRIDAALGKKAARFRPTWTLMAASLVAAIALSSGSTWLALRSPAGDLFSAGLIDSHMRALSAPQPIDVMSSDGHTVKPWFNGKIPQSPQVMDLAARGFPLVGGRIDVVNKAAVPTLVYSKDRHLISVTSVPSFIVGIGPSSTPTTHGFNVVSWKDGDTVNWAISDLNINDLNLFARFFQKAS